MSKSIGITRAWKTIAKNDFGRTHGCGIGHGKLSNQSHSSTKLFTTTASRLPQPLILRGRRLFVPKRQLADTINQRAALLHATGHTAVTRRYIQAGVAGEKVARPQQQAHRLSRHDGKVLRAGEVSEAKGMPEDDIGVFQVRGRVGCDPGWDALGGVAGGLRHVAACWVELGIVVFGAWLEGRSRDV